MQEQLSLGKSLPGWDTKAVWWSIWGRHAFLWDMTKTMDKLIKGINILVSKNSMCCITKDFPPLTSWNPLYWLLSGFNIWLFKTNFYINITSRILKHLTLATTYFFFNYFFPALLRYTWGGKKCIYLRYKQKDSSPLKQYFNTSNCHYFFKYIFLNLRKQARYIIKMLQWSIGTYLVSQHAPTWTHPTSCMIKPRITIAYDS